MTRKYHYWQEENGIHKQFKLFGRHKFQYLVFIRLQDEKWQSKMFIHWGVVNDGCQTIPECAGILSGKYTIGMVNCQYDVPKYLSFSKISIISFTK